METGLVIINGPMRSIQPDNLNTIFPNANHVVIDKAGKFDNSSSFAIRGRTMEWIMSEGGPLIFMEKAAQNLWGGVDRLTVPDGTSITDYDRACATNDYLIALPLGGSMAFAVGEGPMLTYVWRSTTDILYIVQAFYGEDESKDQEKLDRINDSLFDKPEHTAEWQVATSPIALFDSAWPGVDEPNRKVIYFDMRPGRYRIRTQVYNPDMDNSFLLHRFDPID